MKLTIDLPIIDEDQAFGRIEVNEIIFSEIEQQIRRNVKQAIKHCEDYQTFLTKLKIKTQKEFLKRLELLKEEESK